jgi:hypothetical protein
MKRKKLKPVKLWALRWKKNLARTLIDEPALLFKTKAQAVQYQGFYSSNDRPEIIRLEVKEI